jgi:hypothetical protein
VWDVEVLAFKTFQNQQIIILKRTFLEIKNGTISVLTEFIKYSQLFAP